MSALRTRPTPAVYNPTDNIFFCSRCHRNSTEFVEFLTLPIYDPLPNAPTGFPLGVALDACQIAHCNKPGFLSTSTDRSDTAAHAGTDRATILTSTRYYYHLDDPNVLPTICSSFVVWDPPVNPEGVNPPLQIAQDWFCDDRSDSAPYMGAANWTSISNEFKAEYDSCSLSTWRDGSTTAHLIPKSLGPWFRSHQMSRFASTPLRGVNDVRNLIPLRADLRILGFDRAHFVFVPKNGVMVAHFIRRTKESANLYHNIIDTASASPVYLYYRFAWSILCCVNEFLVPDTRVKLNIKAGRSTKTTIGYLKSASVDFASGIEAEESEESEASEMDTDMDLSTTGPMEAVDDVVNSPTEGIDDRELFQPRSSSGSGKSSPIPDLSDPRARYFYNNLTWHSETPKMDKLRQRYIEEHPNVRETLAAEFATATESDEE